MLNIGRVDQRRLAPVVEGSWSSVDHASNGAWDTWGSEQALQAAQLYGHTLIQTHLRHGRLLGDSQKEQSVGHLTPNASV
jgi:hypothetical protein